MSPVDCVGDLCEPGLNPRPRGGHQDQNTQGAIVDILLITQVLIRSDEKLVPGFLSPSKQLAVRKGGPSYLGNGIN